MKLMNSTVILLISIALLLTALPGTQASWLSKTAKKAGRAIKKIVDGKCYTYNSETGHTIGPC